MWLSSRLSGFRPNKNDIDMCLQFIKNTSHVPSLTDLRPISVAFLRIVCDGAFTVHDDLILALVYTFLSCHIYLDRKQTKQSQRQEQIHLSCR